MSIFSNLLPKKKPKKGGLFIPAFLRTVSTGSKISDDRNNRANEDLTQIRYGTTTEEIVRDYSKNSPDVSHAVETTMRFLITGGYTLYAKELETGRIDPAATEMLQAFSNRLDKLPTDVTKFSPQSSIKAISESLVSQLLTNGVCAGELVLDKALLPTEIRPISTNNLEYRSAGTTTYPIINDSGGETELNSPAVCIRSLSQDPETPYATSWYKSAVQPIISSAEFTNDLRKAFRKANIPRVTAEIEIAKFKETLSAEVLYDTEKYAAALKTAISDIENQLNGLNPEDAIVNFDVVKVDHLTSGNNSSHEAVQTHANYVNGQISTGLHILPSLLGRGESQSTASTEAVLFLKTVESLQNRMNDFFSYMFSLAARLHGHDVVAVFEFEKPSLRPEIEEESFLAMRQARIMERLSYGFISDEEASIRLTGNLPSGNFQPLSGTRFYAKSGETADNPYSNTSVSGEQTNNTKIQKDLNQGNSNPTSTKTTG